MAYADSVKQFLDALKIPKAIIVGHSMGGAIALTMGVYMKHICCRACFSGNRSKVNGQSLIYYELFNKTKPMQLK